MAIKFLNSTDTDSGVLYVDATNDRVGIGTISPQAKLDVTGEVRSDKSANGISFSSTGGGSAFTAFDVYTATDGGLIRLYNESTQTVNIDGRSAGGSTYFNNGGNVGIGTTSPSQKLEVAGHAYINNGTNSNVYLETTDNWIYGDVNGVGIFNANNNLRLYTVGSERLRINSAGNVGIGNTSPTNKLDVSGAISATFVRFGSAASGETITRDASNGLAFTTSGTGVTRMTITNGGNVGIGTTSPATRLEVSSSGAEGILISKDTGTPSNSGRLFFETDTVSEGFSFLNSNGIMTIRSQAQAGATSGNVRVAIDGSGNVGIGTTSPGAKFHIASSSAAHLVSKLEQDNSGYQAWYEANSQDGGYARFGIGADASDYTFWNTDQSKYIWFGSSVELMRLTNAGALGIGTTSPKSMLHVAKQGNANGGSMIIGPTGSGTAKWSYLAGTHYNQDTGSGNGSGSAGVALIGSLSADTYNRVYIGGGPYEINPATEIQLWTYTATTHNLGGTKQMTINSSGEVTFHQYGAGYLKSDASGNITVDADLIEDTLDSVTDRGNTTSNAIIVGRVEAMNGGTDSGQSGTTIKIGKSASTGKSLLIHNESGDAHTWFNYSDGSNYITADTSNTGGRNIFRRFNGTSYIEDMRIDSSGNVGIGTSAPAKKLEVAGDLLVKDTDTTGQVQLINSTNNGLRITTWSQGANIDPNTIDDDIFIGRDVDIRKLVLSSGNLGIGSIFDSTNPTEKLHVSGNVKVEGSVSVTNIVTNRIVKFNGSILDDSLLYDNGTNVGIGTTSPAQKLHVAGTGRFTDNLYSTSTDVDGIKTRFLSGAANNSTNDGTLYLQYGKSHNVSIGETGSSNLYVAGNVGIGTTSPGKKLEVRTPINTESSIRIRQLSYNYWDLKSPASDTGFTIGDVGGEKLRITSSGNVGIGTTSPNYKLEVSGKIATPAGAIVIEGQEIYANSEYSGNDGSVRINRFGYLGGQTKFRDTVIYDGKGNQILTVDGSASSVGIGTIAPLQLLHLSKTGANPYIRISSDAFTGLDIGQETSAGNAVVNLRDNKDIRFLINNNDVVRIKNNGNVGIGTTSPTSKLHVASGTIEIDNGQSLSSRTSGGSNLFPLIGMSGNAINVGGWEGSYMTDLYLMGGNGAVLADFSQGNSKFFAVRGVSGSTPSEYMRVTSSGNVGIGLTSPLALLDIAKSSTASLLLRNGDISNGSNNRVQIRFSFDGTSNYSHFITSRHNSSSVSGNALDFYVGDTTSGGTYPTNAIHNLTLNGGNVGIGTTSPSVLLDVNKSTIGEYAYFGSGSTRQLRLSSYNTASDHAGHKINASSLNGQITLATNNIAALTVKNDQTVQLNAYGAGYLKSDANGNITVDADIIEDTLDSVTDRGSGTTNSISVGAINLSNDPATNNGTFVKVYSDEHKRTYVGTLDFSFTAAGTYNFNLVFPNSGGYQYELTAVNSRNGLYRNFGTLKDSSYIYWESDEDFTHRAEGDVHLISNHGNGMYFSADNTFFLSDGVTDSEQTGTATWSYAIVRYSIYLPYDVGAATGSWKLHLTTYGDTGSGTPQFVLA